ncbi:MAG TPA: RNA-binding S4 domain-containing protein [Candidatus Omnitrophota bacterium]|nr:RNA-binding S4 domain-containing protein [Candidatus Omnitrophota bacterium]HRY85551.1 RNA-binding S4 domain-containing protein [Candidatus Omnitrophota bacterium]
MNEIPFTPAGEFIELFKLLKATGLCDSGGLAKYAIANSQVKVDGQIETRKACKIRQGQRVEFSGHTILVR